MTQAPPPINLMVLFLIFHPNFELFCFRFSGFCFCIWVFVFLRFWRVFDLGFAFYGCLYTLMEENKKPAQVLSFFYFAGDLEFLSSLLPLSLRPKCCCVCCINSYKMGVKVLVMKIFSS